jgi:integrase
MEASGRRRGAGKRLGPRQVGSIVRFVAAGLNWAAAQGRILDNPTGGTDYPRAPHRNVNLEDDVLADYLIVSLGHWLHVPIACAVLAGLRLGEIYGRRRSEIDLREQTIRVPLQGDRAGLYDPKTAAGDRIVVIPELLVRLLQDVFDEQDLTRSVFEPDPWLVLHPDGSPRARASLDPALKVALTHWDVPVVRLHDMRHGYASQVYAAVREDEAAKAIIALMGHANIRTTERVYVHPLLGAQRRIVALFDARMSSAFERRRIARLG